MEQEKVIERMLENEANIKQLEVKLRALLEVLAAEGVVVADDVKDREEKIIREEDTSK